ncbi:MAG: SMP-30/gluconolactonase/LRE family protein [Bacteroidota bacterium]
MKYFLLLPLILLSACQMNQPAQEEDQEGPTIQSFDAPYETKGSIEIMDSTMLNYIAVDAPLEILAEGFTWSEGPLWIPEQSFLIFSDVPMNRIYRWQESKGIDVYLTPSGYTGETTRGGEPGSNGLTLTPEGKLMLCQHGDRRVAMMNAALGAPQSQFAAIASAFEGKKLNSPNDLAYSSSGHLYFTDPPYGLQQQDEDPAKELSFQGVFKVDTAGSISLQIDSLTRPNGIACSPDGRTLYVANSDPEKARWMAYDLDEEGNVVTGRILLDVTAYVGEANPGLPDGLKIHPDGTLFATGPGGVWVIRPDGKPLGIIRTVSKTANCAWGPGGYLYMTSHQFLMRVKVAGA